MRLFRAIFFALLVGCVTASAYNYNYNTSGDILRWDFYSTNSYNISTNVLDRNTKSVRFFIATNGWSTTNTAAEVNAVRNCFGQWQAIPNSIVKFEEGGSVPPGYDVNTSDHTNVVYWATNDLVDGGTDNIAGLAGVCFRSYFADNTLAEWDIVLNGADLVWFTDITQSNNPGYFVEGTLCHEIGHSLGMEHASIGGPTMVYAGQAGVDTQAGLSVDEIAFVQSLYPASNLLASLSTLKGTVTKSGSGILGAAVIIEKTNGNLAGSTVTLTDGSYSMSALPPGNYNVRVVPLDPASANYWLMEGADISSAYTSADTSFLPTGNFPVTLTAGATNTLNFTVTNGNQAFRITLIRKPTTNPGSYSIIGLPDTMWPGQSNYTIGVFSEDLPTSGATFTITGDGLTLGSPTFQPANVFVGLNGISMSISVSSNATPGLRTLIVQQGTNIAYANGYLEILPPFYDFNFDGLDDVFQRQYFFPFTQTNAAPTADPDHDGFDNTAEFIAGTNPTNALSLLKLTSVTKAANGTTIAWQSVTNRLYQVMTRTNLVTGTWQNVGGVQSPTGTNSTFLDTSATNGVHFYRVQVLP